MKIEFIKKSLIEPSTWNPRKEVDDESLNELKKSIKKIGIIHPIIVRPNQSKPNFYLISAGFRRWKTYPDDALIPCIVINETELNAKIRGIHENLMRKGWCDSDLENIMHNAYQEGLKNGDWKNYSEMSKEAKIPIQIISERIQAYKDRKTLGFRDHEKQPSTSDLKESRPLKDKPKLRKKLLQERLDSKIKGSGHIIHQISKELKDKPDLTLNNLENKIDIIIRNKTPEKDQKIKHNLQMLQEMHRFLKNFNRFQLEQVLTSEELPEFKKVIKDIHERCIFLIFIFNRKQKYLEYLEKKDEKTSGEGEVKI